MLRGIEDVASHSDAPSAVMVLERLAQLEVASARLLAAAVRANAGSTELTALVHHESLRCLRERLVRLCRQMWNSRPRAEEDARARLAMYAAHWEAFRWECEALELALGHAAGGRRDRGSTGAWECVSVLCRLFQLVDRRVDDARIAELSGAWRRAKQEFLDRMEQVCDHLGQSARHAEETLQDLRVLASRVSRVARDPAHHLWTPPDRIAGHSLWQRAGRRRPNP